MRSLLQSRRFTPFPLAILILALLVVLWVAARIHPETSAYASAQGVTGRVIDTYQQPVEGATVSIFLNDSIAASSHTETQPDGSYQLEIPSIDNNTDHLRLTVERPHFASTEVTITADQLIDLRENRAVIIPAIHLSRKFEASFWVATLAFVGMLAIIATEKMHNTLAALLSVSVILGVSLIGGTFSPTLFIFNFEQALHYIDFEVIFLLMGMMIVIGVVEETGIFQWMAYQAFRLSGGRVWLLVIILMLIAGVSSALLDNVTTMLLVTPITLEIALAIGVNPLVLIMPALLAANTGGSSTLIGTPVNIMIGAFADLGFNDFALNLTPGIVMAMIGLGAYLLWHYRKDHLRKGRKLSKALLKRLEQNGQIKDFAKLRKAGVVFVGLLALFVFGERVHLTPAVSAIIGAVAMLIWVHPDIEEMMGVVDWTTLVFFIGLFISVGALAEVGLLALIASTLSAIVGSNLMLALQAVTWGAAVLSGLVDNIPFTAAMLPVTQFLSQGMPGANDYLLYYALAVGASLGGNLSLIGSSANLVVAGILERAGYKLSFLDFLKIGIPVTFITVGLGVLWLVLHFGV